MDIKGTVGTPTFVSGVDIVLNPAPRPFHPKPGQPSKLQRGGKDGKPATHQCRLDA